MYIYIFIKFCEEISLERDQGGFQNTLLTRISKLIYSKILFKIFLNEL